MSKHKAKETTTNNKVTSKVAHHVRPKSCNLDQLDLSNIKNSSSYDPALPTTPKNKPELHSHRKLNTEDRETYDNRLESIIPERKTHLVKEKEKLITNINFQDKEGNTSLIKAAMDGDLVTVENILKSKPNINLQNNKLNTALMEALKHKHPVIAQKLLAIDGIDLDLINKAGENALTVAEVYLPVMVQSISTKINPGAYEKAEYNKLFSDILNNSSSPQKAFEIMLDNRHLAQEFVEDIRKYSDAEGAITIGSKQHMAINTLSEISQENCKKLAMVYEFYCLLDSFEGNWKALDLAMTNDKNIVDAIIKYPQLARKVTDVVDKLQFQDELFSKFHQVIKLYVNIVCVDQDYDYIPVPLGDENYVASELSGESTDSD